MQNSIDAIYLLNDHGDVLNVNDAACEALGYSRDELLSLSIGDIDTNFDREAFQKFWEQKPHERTILFETIHRRGDGSTFPVEVNGIQFEIDGENYLYGVARDITERKQAAERIAEAEKIQRALITTIDASLFLMEHDGTLVVANEGLARTFNKTVDELIGTSVYDLIPPDLAARRRKITEQVVRSGKPETIVDERDGRTIESYIFPLHNELGEATRIAILGLDITDQKQAEEALRESERILLATGRMARIGGWEHDLATGEATWTKPLYDIVELDSAKPPGVNEHLSYYPPEDRQVI
jgi:PAS domain S-box-containing protein